MFFDTHVNLHSDQFDTDREVCLSRARAVGVKRFITICDRIDRFDSVLRIANAHADIWCSYGVHPHYADDYTDLTADMIVAGLISSKIIGIGETGLDFHYGYSTEKGQTSCFRAHIQAARKRDLPVIIHSRAADQLMGDILEDEYANGPFKMLMHCYTSGQKLAERALRLGAYFSVSGIISFKNADNVRDIVSRLPLERILLETDCPYLAPIPYRGKRNEPSFLPNVCRAFANLHNISMEEGAQLTTENAIRFFRI